jgi:multidrug efflux pump subunit AcrB
MDVWAQLQPSYPNVNLDFSGELDDIQESLDSIGILFLFGLGVMYLILGTQFKSYGQPLLILVTVPLAFTGVVLGLFVTGNPLSLYTLYGVVALSGIAVNSAYCFNQCCE